MKQAYIIDALRTPVGKFGGTLATIRPDDLAAHIIREIMARNPNIDFEQTEDVIFGAANQAGEDNRNVARMALLMAGMKPTVPGVTINRLCASGLQTITDAAMRIMLGYGDLFIAGGVESMSRAPFVMGKAETPFSRKAEIYDTAIGWRFKNPQLSALHYPYEMGETAENIAAIYQISREEQDIFAHNTQLKYQKAHEQGKFENEISAVSIPRRKQEALLFNKDEHPRLSSVEKLNTLKPAFRQNGTVTAGNSSGINDGSAALIIASEDIVKKNNLKPLARVVSFAAAGVAPEIMGIGPVPSTLKAIKRAGIKEKELDLIELNEAFAAQSLACIRDLDLDPEKVNVNGGSIAIGHPLGCSGARIATTLIHEMQKQQNVKYGLATMCIGVGQGLACIFEKV